MSEGSRQKKLWGWARDWNGNEGNGNEGNSCCRLSSWQWEEAMNWVCGLPRIFHRWDPHQELVENIRMCWRQERMEIIGAFQGLWLYCLDKLPAWQMAKYTCWNYINYYSRKRGKVKDKIALVCAYPKLCHKLFRFYYKECAEKYVSCIKKKIFLHLKFRHWIITPIVQRGSLIKMTLEEYPCPLYNLILKS